MAIYANELSVMLWNTEHFTKNGDTNVKLRKICYKSYYIVATGLVENASRVQIMRRCACHPISIYDLWFMVYDLCRHTDWMLCVTYRRLEGIYIYTFQPRVWATESWNTICCFMRVTRSIYKLVSIFNINICSFTDTNEDCTEELRVHWRGRAGLIAWLVTRWKLYSGNGRGR